jgi:hypothetical protein
MQTGDDVSGRRDDGGDDATALDARRDATRARAYDARDASDATDDATVNADMTTTTTTRRAGGRGPCLARAEARDAAAVRRFIHYVYTYVYSTRRRPPLSCHQRGRPSFR